MGPTVPVITKVPLATSKTVTSRPTPPGKVAGGGDGSGLGEVVDLANNTDCCTTCLAGRAERKGERGEGGGGEDGEDYCSDCCCTEEFCSCGPACTEILSEFANCVQILGACLGICCCA